MLTSNVHQRNVFKGIESFVVKLTLNSTAKIIGSQSKLYPKVLELYMSNQITIISIK